MDLSARLEAEAMIVDVRESRIDAAVAIQFKDAMRELAADAPQRIVLNLAQVNFMDSSGLGAVIGTMKLLAPDHRLELAGLTQAVQKVFRLTRMDKVFVIHTDIAAATGQRANAG